MMIEVIIIVTRHQYILRIVEWVSFYYYLTSSAINKKKKVSRLIRVVISARGDERGESNDSRVRRDLLLEALRLCITGKPGNDCRPWKDQQNFGFEFHQSLNICLYEREITRANRKFLLNLRRACARVYRYVSKARMGNARCYTRTALFPLDTRSIRILFWPRSFFFFFFSAILLRNDDHLCHFGIKLYDWRVFTYHRQF